MKACLLFLSSLALVSLAQKVPVKCDWEKEMSCPGEWDPKTGTQITADFCIPNKVGDCFNACPMKCGEKDMLCPGKMDLDGCKMPDTCNPGKFCPVDCDWEKEKMCAGDWDPKTGQQMTADFCIPNKVGECANHCPMKCGENDMMCPGKMDPNGCKMPDTCNPGKFCPANCDWEKEMTCAGTLDPKTGEPTTADYCIPNKVGECINHCPMPCGEKDMICPGKMDAMGCKMPDMCFPAGKECPKM